MPGLPYFLQIGCEGDHIVCIGDLVHDIPDWEDPRRITPQGAPPFGEIQPQRDTEGRW